MKDINNLYQLIGSNLKQIRIEQKISQEKMSEDLNMSRSHISKIEAPGVESGVSIDTLFLIAKTYNIDIRRFFDGYEQFITANNNK